MGSNWSSLEREPSPDPWWPVAQTQPTTRHDAVMEESAPETSGTRSGGRVKEEEINILKQELAQKRALRHEAMTAIQAQIRDLKNEVEQERSLKQQAEEERDKLKSISVEEIKNELEKERQEKNKLLEKNEQLMEEVEEKSGLERQVQALKNVAEIGKEMLRIRELQVKELKKKLVELNISSVMAPPEDLRIEYETQIENIRKLRTLYEERASATLLEHKRELEREEAKRAVLEAKLSELQKELEEYKESKKELEEKIEHLQSSIQQKENELESTKDDLFYNTVQNKSLSSQINLINNLFSQMLIEPKVDLDRLTRILKENHGLITDLTAKGDSNEVAALLVDLAGQIEKEQETQNNVEENSKSINESCESQSEIAVNLNKVWKVMVELLSHHKTPNHTELAGGSESCYKCIQTPNGPRSVISVSQTFLTLKDLILEKNSLVKEVGRLKTLNDHLEHRLGSQEKRLSIVTMELRKTWGVVNKLRAQHKQLHTHEKILRYELQQKRCMLTELKEELEHCKDKWQRARQKNNQTEEDWKKLRQEFAARKSRKESNSAESGYEEEDSTHSPPSEPVNNNDNTFELTPNNINDPELSEEEIEHSDGNSFDTVIDLLDIACLESQSENESEIPFVLCEIHPQTSEISSNIIPLTDSEFSEGLDQIESEDLAAALDIQYQNQLLGADYNLYLPSSSGSSPVPTENDDFASSEIDTSEEDSFLHDNHIYPSPVSAEKNTSVSEEGLLFGANSSKNISKFLEGLFVEQQQSKAIGALSENFPLHTPSTSQKLDYCDNETPQKSLESTCEFQPDCGVSFNENESRNESQTCEKEKIKEELMPEEQSFEVKQFDIQSSSLDAKEGRRDELISAENLQENSITRSKDQTQEEMLNAREDRLKKLEQQCRSLVSKVMSSSLRSDVISNKLDKAHISCSSLAKIASEGDPVSEYQRSENEQSSVLDDGQNAEANVLYNLVVDSERPLPITENNKCIKTDDSCPKKVDYAAQPSTSSQVKTPEEILAARAARLKRLEDQCKSLFSKMSATSSRSEVISNKLDELHEVYGNSEQTKENHSSSQQCSSKSDIVGPEQNQNNNIHPNKKSQHSIIKKQKDFQTINFSSEDKEILDKPSLPSGRSITDLPVSDHRIDRTPEEILEARAERFKRLEEQCKSLVAKMTATSLRSEMISNKLDELHSCYGSEDTSNNDSENEGQGSSQLSSPKCIRKSEHFVETDEKLKVTNADDRVSSEENISEIKSLISEEMPMVSTPDLQERPPYEVEERTKPSQPQFQMLESLQKRDMSTNRSEEHLGQASTSIQYSSLPIHEQCSSDILLSSSETPAIDSHSDQSRTNHVNITDNAVSLEEIKIDTETNSVKTTNEEVTQQNKNV